MNPDGSGYDELYGIVRRVAPWCDLVAPDMTIAADVRLQSCKGWNHSTVASRCILAAVSDALRDNGYALCFVVACMSVLAAASAAGHALWRQDRIAQSAALHTSMSNCIWF